MVYKNYTTEAIPDMLCPVTTTQSTINTVNLVESVDSTELTDSTLMRTNLQVIIFCGGKCGSSTLLHTFLSHNMDTIHMHSFESLDKNIYSSLSNINDFITIQKQNIIYIIDSYRTPIERHISAFFQNIHTHVKKNCEKINVNILILKKCFLTADT